MVKTPSGHRTPLTSVALSKFATQRLMQRWVASTIQGADWKTERKSLFHCKIWSAEWDGWARGKIDLCVTVSFYEQAKLLWHKTHDIYSQKCGINCYHPDFLMGTYFNFLVTMVPRLSHCQERGCPAAEGPGRKRGWVGRERDGNVHPTAALERREFTYVSVEFTCMPEYKSLLTLLVTKKTASQTFYSFHSLLHLVDFPLLWLL